MNNAPKPHVDMDSLFSPFTVDATDVTALERLQEQSTHYANCLGLYRQAEAHELRHRAKVCELTAHQIGELGLGIHNGEPEAATLEFQVNRIEVIEHARFLRELRAIKQRGSY